MDRDTLVVTSIKDFLNSKHIRYSYVEHEPTPTSEDAARVRGTSPEEGAKAIILKTSSDERNVMVVLPGNLKLDSKKVKKVLMDDISFENPDLILERFGIVVGGVPPFGNLLGEGMQVLIDEKLLDNKNVSFNCGKRTASITISASDYKKAMKDVSIVGDFTKQV